MGPPLFTSILVLHWASVLLVVWFLRRAGGRLTDIGFDLTPAMFAMFVAIVVGVGFALIYLRSTWPAATELSEIWQLGYPWTRSQRMLGIAVYLSAGFCEEFVYRGFAIRVLQAHGFRTGQAIALATAAFVAMHGIAALFLFPLLNLRWHLLLVAVSVDEATFARHVPTRAVRHDVRLGRLSALIDEMPALTF